VDALRLRLAADTVAARPRPPAARVEAYDLYLRGRHHLHRRSQAGIERAIEYFERAIAADSIYAYPHAGLADAYWLLPQYGDRPPAALLPRAKASALRALALDSTLAEAHSSLGTASFYLDRDPAIAERRYRRAIRLNASYATAHHMYAMLLSAQGRAPEAVAEVELARRADPLALSINTAAGIVNFAVRRYPAARRALERTLDLDPSHWLAHVILGWVATEERKLDEALALHRRAATVSGGEAEARQLLAQLGRRAYAPSFLVAAIHAGLGDREAAFTWLERSAAEHDIWMTRLNAVPWFDAMRGDPRHARLAALLQLGRPPDGASR
jgi:tetratricopeptide (TPR) repeat protein